MEARQSCVHLNDFALQSSKSEALYEGENDELEWKIVKNLQITGLTNGASIGPVIFIYA